MVRRRRDKRGEYWVDFRHGGRRIRRKSPDQTRRGAEDFERGLRGDIAETERRGHDPFAGPPPRFRDFACQWYDEYAVPRNRPSTQHEKLCALRARLIPAFGDLRLDQITSARIDMAIRNWRMTGLSPKRVNNLLAILRRCLAVAEERGLIITVPKCRSLRALLPVPKYIAREDLDRLLPHLEPLLRTLALFVFTTGVRFGEAAGLLWEDVGADDNGPHVFIRHSVVDGNAEEYTKTSKSRRVLYLVPETATALSRHPRTSPHVFATSDGGLLKPGMFYTQLAHACKAAGIKRITWHPLRHSCATELARHGVPLNVIADVLGHTTLDMTRRYAHAAPSTVARYMQVLSGHRNGNQMGILADEAPPLAVEIAA